MDVQPVVPDFAASVLVIRPDDDGLEVLMVERINRGFFGGLVVFPGGKVDEIDQSELAKRTVSGNLEDHEFRSAALRELAEETGLAATENGVVRAPRGRDGVLLQSLADRGEVLAGESLVLISRWVTPEGAPRRFDTLFYLLPAASTPEIDIDPDELVGFAWSRPAEALSKYESGEWPMFLPTVAHLRWLHKRASIDDAIQSAQGADGRTLIKPQRVEDGSIVPIHLPAELP